MKIKSSLILTIALILIPLKSFADGGISLGATRVIYPEGARQTSLPVSNSSSSQRFLINSWIENSDGEKDSSFIVTPPLYVSEAKTENTLRIIYAGKPLPIDRESLFYLNVKSIPSIDREAIAGKNILQLAILSRIKIFVRPKNLPMQETDAPKKLKFTHSGGKILIHNPTPYYITMVNVMVGGKKLESTMVSPMSTASIDSNGSQIIFQSINDYGALEKPMIRNIQ